MHSRIVAASNSVGKIWIKEHEIISFTSICFQMPYLQINTIGTQLGEDNAEFSAEQCVPSFSIIGCDEYVFLPLLFIIFLIFTNLACTRKSPRTDTRDDWEVFYSVGWLVEMLFNHCWFNWRTFEFCFRNYTKNYWRMWGFCKVLHRSWYDLASQIMNNA